MAIELTVFLENRPGTFAGLGEALGNAGINIQGICGFTCEGKGIIHVLVENSKDARPALENAGIQVQGERDVLILAIKDKPGAFGKICRQLTIAGVNINLVYLTTQNQLILGVDDYNKARTALKIP
jgi:hypothetical protein